MIFLLRAVSLSMAVFFAAPSGAAAALPDALRSQQIVTVDGAAGLLAVGVDAADRKIYRCTGETKVTINDRAATLADLEPGMVVVVTSARPGVAARVAAVQVKTVAERPLQKVIWEKTVMVPATNTGRRAMSMARVFAGQIVRIVAREPVRWTSGGARKGQFCGWNGLAGDQVLGMPRMALVAFVDKTPFLAAGDRFTFTVPADGTFGLFANDDDPAGNEGSADLLITIAWY